MLLVVAPHFGGNVYEAMMVFCLIMGVLVFSILVNRAPTLSLMRYLTPACFSSWKVTKSSVRI